MSASSTSSTQVLDMERERKAAQVRKMQEGARARREAGLKPQTLSSRAGVEYNASNLRANMVYLDTKKPTAGRVAAEIAAMEEVFCAALMHDAANEKGVVTTAGIQRACALHPHYEVIAASSVAVRHLEKDDWLHMQAQSQARREKRKEKKIRKWDEQEEAQKAAEEDAAE